MHHIPGTSAYYRDTRAALAMLFVSLVASFLLFEIITRHILDDGMHFDLEMWKYAKDLKRVSEVKGVGHEHWPNRSGTYMGVPVAINSIGLRDGEYPLEKPSNAVRIIMLGDSLTFGWGVRIEDTPAKKLERNLNANPTGRAYEVINAGIGNSNTAMQVAYFLAKGAKLKPDIVVLNYFINDAEETPRRKTGYLSEYSYAAVFIAGQIDKLLRLYFSKSNWQEYYTNLYLDTAPGWIIAQSAMKRLIAYCKQHDIKLLIAHYPELHHLKPYPFAKVTAAVSALTASNDVPFVDLLPQVADFEPQSLWVSETDAHSNAKANRAFAKTLQVNLRKAFPALFTENAS